MKIIKETQTELVLELKPTFFQVIYLPILMLLVLYAISTLKELSNQIYEFEFKSIFIALFGLCLMYYISRTTNLRIDKCESKISASSITVFGLKKCSFDLREIKKIETQILAGSPDGFVSIIFMQSGKRFDLWYGFDYKTAVMKTNKVREFLGFPADSRLVRFTGK